MILTKTENREYAVMPYDAVWPRRYEAEAQNLKQVFGNALLHVEHIGGTAVPGLSARPAIDIIVVVSDMESVRNYLRDLAMLGYIDKGDYFDNGVRLFSKMGMVNLYVAPRGHEYVAAQLGFKEYLLNNPDIILACNEKPEALSEKFAEYQAVR